MMDKNNQDIDKLKQEFIANASHELKTPVTSIQLAVETAISALENSEIEDAKRFMTQILQDSQRMTLLLSDLLDLSQLEVNNPEKELVNLKSIIDAEIGFLSDENKNRVVFESEDIEFLIDPNDFSMIIRNLLRNACNYSELDKEINVNLFKDKSSIVLSVVDKGRGIATSDHERVFERFYRVDKGRSRSLGGTGIGLSIVKHAVDRNGGLIELDSVLGSGTTFTIKFE
ncbi:ATP-binding protein [Acidimicrobiaceae bacterium]|jgi:two-component system phosphate regulon sensor histidine kinase PhoR|nr:ATP-binding protein [Acidimicrobiaceae bacterium]MEC7840846.1 ATP-binding protein [Actinomycetota bacterium]MEC8329417.1 ATP-binding protein [Actinomycetota bacterium]MED5382461.1 ATP-binding protein [Actinomycetota bacterium]|tara:strand:+ start:5801 stop:6487 length:687 start_codon:yes stop_codon:yes gene_type:complete